MSNTLSKTIQDLEEQKKRIDSALRVLRGLNQSDGRSAPRRTRAISEAGRKRIAEAQKRRWAKIRAKKSSPKAEA